MRSNLDRVRVNNRLNVREANLGYASRSAPRCETICAVIVTLNPDFDFVRRIAKVRPQVSQIVLVDNGSDESCVSRLCELAKGLDLHPILNRTNRGVATALNQGAKWAVGQEYQWILTLDQDTVVAPDMVDSLAAVYEAFPVRDRLAVIGSDYTSLVNGKRRTNHENTSWGKEVETVITSGTLVSLQAYLKIGGFRDDFFVDCVD